MTKLVRCLHCNYEWKTKSKMIFVSCPCCLKKVKIKNFKLEKRIMPKDRIESLFGIKRI